jgi:hypothetical protein
MRKTKKDLDEILSEYDFSRSRPNKYASRYAKGSLVAIRVPDVAAIFPGVGRIDVTARLSRMRRRRSTP